MTGANVRKMFVALFVVMMLAMTSAVLAQDESVISGESGEDAVASNEEIEGSESAEDVVGDVVEATDSDTADEVTQVTTTDETDTVQTTTENDTTQSTAQEDTAQSETQAENETQDAAEENGGEETADETQAGNESDEAGAEANEADDTAGAEGNEVAENEVDTTGANTTGNATGNESEGAAVLRVKEWYPKGSHYVFECIPPTGFDPFRYGYGWEFGDGELQRLVDNADVYHIYEAPGTYEVMCTVLDSDGETEVSAQMTVTVAEEDVQTGDGNTTGNETDTTNATSLEVMVHTCETSESQFMNMTDEEKLACEKMNMSDGAFVLLDSNNTFHVSDEECEGSNCTGVQGFSGFAASDVIVAQRGLDGFDDAVATDAQIIVADHSIVKLNVVDGADVVLHLVKHVLSANEADTGNMTDNTTDTANGSDTAGNTSTDNTTNTTDTNTSDANVTDDGNVTGNATEDGNETAAGDESESMSENEASDIADEESVQGEDDTEQGSGETSEETVNEAEESSAGTEDAEDDVSGDETPVDEEGSDVQESDEGTEQP